MDHPSEETLKRFAAGTASREESRIVVAHLVKGCALCASKLRTLIEPAAVAGSTYEEALERFDQELIGSLESSVSPAQVLRMVLKSVPRQRLLEDETLKKR
ncbi:MAG TPA: hypothetical protein VGH73_12020 [Thermoanaerobaculia bacterium]